MQEEMRALHKNDTWELIKLPNVKKGNYMQMGVYRKAMANGSVQDTRPDWWHIQ